MACDLHVVPQRLEELTEQRLTPTAGQDRQSSHQRKRPIGELGPLLAATVKGRPEYARERHAEERRRDIGPIIHVRLKRCVSTLVMAARKCHRIDLEQ